MKYWSGQIEIPSKEQMIQDFHIESERRKEQGKSIRQSHLLNMDQVRYSIYYYDRFILFTTHTDTAYVFKQNKYHNKYCRHK